MYCVHCGKQTSNDLKFCSHCGNIQNSDSEIIPPKKSGISKLATVIIIVVGGLVGMAVIGLIASVVLLSLNTARAKARDAERVAEVRSIASELELFYDTNRSYPESLNSLYLGHIDKIPTAPIPNDGQCSTDDNEYLYEFINANTYKLNFCLGNTASGISAGKHYLNQEGVDKYIEKDVYDDTVTPEEPKVMSTENKELILKVSKLVKLPDEEPTIATVTDPAKLADQPFFRDAELGDKVLIFSKAEKAILYRPSTNRIIEIAPVNLDSTDSKLN